MGESLYDELSEKLRQDPRLARRGGPRFDLSLLLFNARDDVGRLWHAAEAEIAERRRTGALVSEELTPAVEALRPIFGAREDG